MKQYTLADLHTFVAVVESGSFNQAAERMKTSAASVSRRVSALEASLGIRLLNRTTRQVSLTEAGQLYVKDLQPILSALDEAEERLCEGESDIKGNLKMATPLSFGIQSIAPLLPEFFKLHPNLHVDLHVEDHQTDLYVEGIDLALRIGELNDSSLIATRLCDIEFGFYASSEYLHQHGEPLNLEDLSEHDCLHYSLISHSQEYGIRDKSIQLKGSLSANNGEVLREAAIQGVGIVVLPKFIVTSALSKNQLIPILNTYVPKPLGLYALRLSREFTPAKVTTMIRFLQNKLQ